MNALDIRIKELVAYARERDGEDRTNLFRNLVDLFLTGKAPKTDPTRSQLLDVIEALIPHVETDSRRTTCELVANMATPAMDLVLRLCRDRASLAANLLTKVIFDEDDLIELIEKTGREHHQLIASREDLSANIWIALARAAPSAPPFDYQSTLALWSDDLGITQTTPAAKTEHQTAPAPSASTSNAQPNRQSATVTPLHVGLAKGKSSGIRILRTDKDLIAARAQAFEPAVSSQGYAVGQNTIDHDHGINEAFAYQDKTPTDTEAPNKHNIQATYQPLSDPGEAMSGAAMDTAFPQSATPSALDEDKSYPPAQDPGPGGWAWLSDRDGFIISVSPQGQTLHPDTATLAGSSMLDLLGLNTKLGHPVARAFQRRSAIHDAPIFLPSLDVGNQHWTLEATPFFSAGGGIFEGYEGILTPVVPVSNDDNLFQNNDDSSILFLDEMAQKDLDGGRNIPVSFANTASVFATADNGHVNETSSPQNPAPQERGSIENAAHTSVEIKGAAPASSGKSKLAPDLNNLTTAATSVVKELLSEALSPQSTRNTDEPIPEHVPGSHDTMDPASPAPAKNAHIEATLDLLEEALKRLTLSGMISGDAQVRLQGEIASACARALRDQLK